MRLLRGRRGGTGATASAGAPTFYTGPVVFVSGVHYPATGDAGSADLSRPLMWDGERYVPWDGQGPDHAGRYEKQVVDLIGE